MCMCIHNFIYCLGRDPSKRGLHDILTGSATTESIILHTTQAEVIAADVRCRQIAEAIRMEKSFRSTCLLSERE